jgi:nitroreductase
MTEAAKPVIETLAQRRSVRKFESTAIPQTALDTILEAGRKAQSADNRQPWHFVVLQQNREMLHDLFRQQGFKTAPLLLVVLSDREQAWKRHRFDDVNYAEVDAAIAVTEMITAATALGIGSCWVASIDPDRVKDIIGAPAHLHLVGVITFGYPPTPLVLHQKKRKEASEIFHFEKW